MKRFSILPVALLLLIAAACSSDSGSPSTDAATPTAQATATPAESEDGVALPSFGEGAGDLSGVVPSEVGGILLEYQHARGDDPNFLEGDAAPEEALAFLDRLNASPSDITTAFGFGFGPGETPVIVGISAFRVAGADETTLREEYLAILEDEGELGLNPEPTTIAGKTVYTFSSETEDDFSALYSHGDTLWIVFTSSQELLEDALSQLP